MDKAKGLPFIDLITDNGLGRANLYDPKRVDIANLIVAFSVWLFALSIYVMTLAPTLSFWDCGEFIAASFTLGVPHPPGTPLYIIIGRIFSMLPLASDIAVRVNFLSALSSAFTALFAYLAVSRLLSKWFTDNSSFSHFLTYAGGAAGALFAAFSLTNWNNSVEAEVYGMAMMIFMAIFWLILVHWDNRETGRGDQILLLVFYLAFAGIGVHLTTYLIIPVVALFFVLIKDTPKHIWYALSTFFVTELYLIFALSSRVGEIPLYLPVLIVSIFFLFFVFSFERIERRYLNALGLFVLSILPAIYDAITNLTGKTIGSFNGVITFLPIIGIALLFLYGSWNLMHYLKDKKGDQSTASLAVSLFCLGAVIFVGALFIPKGYTSFLVVSACLTVLVALVVWRYLNWTILVAILGVSMIILGVKEFVFGTSIAAVIITILGLGLKLPKWRTALLICLMAILGFSIHAYIPIRSAMQPTINENNPSESLTATINYIERKQYGSTSMTKRMFTRRSEWSNQFGRHVRMGYWGFFSEQYGLNGPIFVTLFLLGIFGIWELIRRRPELGLGFFILLLISSVGLILYMNFADGTRQSPVTGADYLEVRDRDYFFTPAFILFGMAIGLGIPILIQFIREAAAKLSPVTRKSIVYTSSVLFLLPAFALSHNYHTCDRSDNFIPYDYAYNILSSADKDAVLFTNGDNDTFPVWCLQEVYGIRKDVRVVNLSLANTKWYIKQIQDDMKVPLGMTNGQIDSLRPFRTYDDLTFRIQDQVIDAIIQNNLGTIPVNFSVTCGSSSRKFRGQSIDSMLVMRGMSWRVKTVRDGIDIDEDYTLEYYTNPELFKIRGVLDPDIYQDATTNRLTQNYSHGMLLVADELRMNQKLEDAETLVRFAIENIPTSDDATNFLGSLLMSMGRSDELRDLIKNSSEGNLSRLRLLLARSESNAGRFDKAVEIYSSALTEDPHYKPALDDLLRILFSQKKFMELHGLLQVWLENNPNDEQMRGLFTELEKELKRAVQDSSGDGQ